MYASLNIFFLKSQVNIENNTLILNHFFYLSLETVFLKRLKWCHYFYLLLASMNDSTFYVFFCTLI